MPFFAGEPAHWVHNTAALHDSARLHYVEVSPGKANGHTLVLLHGFPETWYAFRHVLQPFADLGYRCVAVDYRGAGDSSRPRDGQGYTKMNMAKDVRVLCSEALGVDKVIVVGYDIGSMIAVSMAMQFPEMVEALITFGEYIFYCSRALGWDKAIPLLRTHGYVSSMTSAEERQKELTVACRGAYTGNKGVRPDDERSLVRLFRPVPFLLPHAARPPRAVDAGKGARVSHTLLQPTRELLSLTKLTSQSFDPSFVTPSDIDICKSLLRYVDLNSFSYP